MIIWIKMVMLKRMKHQKEPEGRMYNLIFTFKSKFGHQIEINCLQL